MTDPRIAAKTKIALDAIGNLFGDTSVTPAATLEALQEIAADLEGKCEALEADIRHKAEGT